MWLGGLVCNSADYKASFSHQTLMRVLLRGFHLWGGQMLYFFRSNFTIFRDLTNSRLKALFIWKVAFGFKRFKVFFHLEFGNKVEREKKTRRRNTGKGRLGRSLLTRRRMMMTTSDVLKLKRGLIARHKAYTKEKTHMDEVQGEADSFGASRTHHVTFTGPNYSGSICPFLHNTQSMKNSKVSLMSGRARQQ